MLKARTIPVLLLKNSGLVKGAQFKGHKYVGDPINAVKIFNEKEVDELMIFDISATGANRGPNFELIKDIASEAFMPLGYGGGISSIEQIEQLFTLGIEKAVINSAAFSNPDLVKNASRLAGSQSIVVSIDVKESLLGRYEVYVNNGAKRTKQNPVDYAKKMENLGAGELVICSIQREGTGKGYDLKLLNAVAEAVDIPVVALGGVGKLEHLAAAIKQTPISAVAAGNLFVFHGKHKAVLITYPEYSKLEELYK